MASGQICAWPRCERAGRYSRLNANGVPVRVCKRHAFAGFPVPLSLPDRAAVKSAPTEVERLRATIARIREICEKGAHEAAYDLRADILAEIGGEA